jgi:predicted PurR-regulated permease PerM
MTQINSEYVVKNHRRQLFLGGFLLMLSLMCVAMTVLFLFVSSSANQRVEHIRQQYRAISERREARVAELTNQLVALQNKLDGLPKHPVSNAADNVQPAEGDKLPPQPKR